MTFNTTNELQNFFKSSQTRRAVNFVLKSDDENWTEIAKNDFQNANSKEFHSYSAAWIYGKKIQKDYFDFLYEIWDQSWKDVLNLVQKTAGKNLDSILSTSDFCSIEFCWKEGLLERGYEIVSPSNKNYNEIWFYIEVDRSNNASINIELFFQLGRNNYSKCGEFLEKNKLSKILGDNWVFEVPEDEDDDEGKFKYRPKLDMENFSFPKTDIEAVAKFLLQLSK